MFKPLKNIRTWLCLLLMGSLSACNWIGIDDDLDDCGKDYVINYSLRLVTNLETEINTVLHAESDQAVAEELRKALTASIFREYAEDVNLSFYDTDNDLVKQEIEQMNAGQATYTIYLPARDYNHLALANIAGAGTVTFQGDQTATTSQLVQQKGDTIDSHATGLFTARQELNVKDNQDQEFYVPLYMANSAAAIVIDTVGYHVRDIRTYINNVGDSFALNDSTYTYNTNTVIRMNDVPVAGTTNVCRYGVCFPSRDSAKDNNIWEIRCYVTLEDGTVTETILTVHSPLQAGQLKIIKTKLGPKGVFEVITGDAGASVTLDWKPGGIYNPSF